MISSSNTTQNQRSEPLIPVNPGSNKENRISQGEAILCNLNQTLNQQTFAQGSTPTPTAFEAASKKMPDKQILNKQIQYLDDTSYIVKQIDDRIKELEQQISKETEQTEQTEQDIIELDAKISLILELVGVKNDVMKETIRDLNKNTQLTSTITEMLNKPDEENLIFKETRDTIVKLDKIENYIDDKNSHQEKIRKFFENPKNFIVFIDKLCNELAKKLEFEENQG